MKNRTKAVVLEPAWVCISDKLPRDATARSYSRLNFTRIGAVESFESRPRRIRLDPKALKRSRDGYGTLRMRLSETSAFSRSLMNVAKGIGAVSIRIDYPGGEFHYLPADVLYAGRLWFVISIAGIAVEAS